MMLRQRCLKPLWTLHIPQAPAVPFAAVSARGKMCCGDPTKHKHASLQAARSSAVHGHGDPSAPMWERTKSAFELDITTEALKDGNPMTGEEDTTALLSDVDDSRYRDGAARTAGAVRLIDDRYLTTRIGLGLAALYRDYTCTW